MSEAEIFAYFVPPLLLVLIGWAGASWHLHQVKKEIAAEKEKEERDSPSFPGFFPPERPFLVVHTNTRVWNFVNRKVRWRDAPSPKKATELTINH